MVSQAERRQAAIAAILKAARTLFARDGFAATTIDDIAREAGLAKGAVYHHFKSKEEILERVLDALQAEIAQRMPAAARGAKSPLDAVARVTQAYLLEISEPGTRRILLEDGPAVLGWEKWREIDVRHFGGPLLRTLKERKNARESEALFHLITGAVTEAARVTAFAKDPKRHARDFAAGIRSLLEGVFGSGFGA